HRRGHRLRGRRRGRLPPRGPAPRARRPVHARGVRAVNGDAAGLPWLAPRAEPDARAPDGSDVHVLVALPAASMIRFTLPEGAVSVPVRHRTVQELWYVVSGRGE